MEIPQNEAISPKVMVTSSDIIQNGQKTTTELKGELSIEFTALEKEVLLRIYSGACNKEIADDLCISFRTVRTHVCSIFRKLQLNNRFQAILWAAKNL